MSDRKRLSKKSVNQLLEKAILLMEDVSEKLDRLYECHNQAAMRIDGDPRNQSDQKQ